MVYSLLKLFRYLSLAFYECNRPYFLLPFFLSHVWYLLKEFVHFLALSLAQIPLKCQFELFEVVIEFLVQILMDGMLFTFAHRVLGQS